MRTLQVLHLGDILLGLQDLTSKRLPTLTTCKAGLLYQPALTKRKDEIAALPALLLGGRPLAVQLQDMDQRHDGLGGALWFYTEAILRWPDATPAMKAAALNIREGLISGLKELGASYATEASRAKDRRLKIGHYKADLVMFPLAGGGTLYDLADQFLTAGEKLDELLSLRADKDGGDRTEVLAMRPASIALLNRFRGAVADELDMDATLPRDLDNRLFGYFDQLEELRAQAAAERKAEEAPAAAAAAAGTALQAATPAEPKKTP